MATTLVWLRFDLRLEDNPALWHAAQRGHVIPVFIWASEEEAPWQPGAASRWWLHHSLFDLSSRFAQLGSRLILKSGSSAEQLKRLIRETKADAVFWNQRLLPTLADRDRAITSDLNKLGIVTRSFSSRILHDVAGVRTGSGTSYRVFTPFWRKFRKEVTIDRPLAAPKLSSPATWPNSDSLEALRLLPKIDWAGGLRSTWTPGEIGAQQALDAFKTDPVWSYASERDRPYMRGTSMLSPHLHFGELSPRQVWHALVDSSKEQGREADAEPYLRQLGWRDFAYSLLHHFPHTESQPLHTKFEGFPWQTNQAYLTRWQRGQTGYPIVDAGMRQLWHTGWMHNRVRMIVASFLTKDLLIHWHEGALWFWNTLVDADLANNTMGWQWSAGSGADAQPFFRIFNPVTQGQRYDPEGAYVKRWVPELSKLPKKFVHAPWEASSSLLSTLGITLGETYPKPIVDHSQARDAALAAYKNLA